MRNIQKKVDMRKKGEDEWIEREREKVIEGRDR
jgi:hypothetical protein